VFGLSPKVTGDPCGLPYSFGGPFGVPDFPGKTLDLPRSTGGHFGLPRFLGGTFGLPRSPVSVQKIPVNWWLVKMSGVCACPLIGPMLSDRPTKNATRRCSGAEIPTHSNTCLDTDYGTAHIRTTLAHILRFYSYACSLHLGIKIFRYFNRKTLYELFFKFQHPKTSSSKTITYIRQPEIVTQTESAYVSQSMTYMPKTEIPGSPGRPGIPSSPGLPASPGGPFGQPRPRWSFSYTMLPRWSSWSTNWQLHRRRW